MSCVAVHKENPHFFFLKHHTLANKIQFWQIHWPILKSFALSDRGNMSTKFNLVKAELTFCLPQIFKVR